MLPRFKDIPMKVPWMLLLFGASLCSGHYIRDPEYGNPKVYQVREGPSGVTFVNPKPGQPTLREILYYHIIERPREEPAITERAFTNGHGYQFLEPESLSDEHDETEDASEHDDDLGHMEDEEMDGERRIIEDKDTDTREDEEPETTTEAKPLTDEDVKEAYKTRSYLFDQMRQRYAVKRMAPDSLSRKKRQAELQPLPDAPSFSNKDAYDLSKTYGMNLNPEGGYVWNNLNKPPTYYELGPSNGNSNEGQYPTAPSQENIPLPSENAYVPPETSNSGSSEDIYVNTNRPSNIPLESLPEPANPELNNNPEPANDNPVATDSGANYPVGPILGGEESVPASEDFANNPIGPEASSDSGANYPVEPVLGNDEAESNEGIANNPIGPEVYENPEESYPVEPIVNNPGLNESPNTQEAAVPQPETPISGGSAEPVGESIENPEYGQSEIEEPKPESSPEENSGDKIKEMPEAPTLPPLNFDSLPDYIRDSISSTENPASNEQTDNPYTNPQPSPDDKKAMEDKMEDIFATMPPVEDIPKTYGMNLTSGGGHVWNDMVNPPVSYDVGTPSNPDEEHKEEQTQAPIIEQPEIHEEPEKPIPEPVEPETEEPIANPEEPNQEPETHDIEETDNPIEEPNPPPEPTNEGELEEPIVNPNQELPEPEQEPEPDTPEIEDKPIEEPAEPEVIPENPELIPENPELIPENPELIPENPELIPENPERIPENPELFPENPELIPENPELIPENPEVIELPEPEQEPYPDTPEIEDKPIEEPAEPEVIPENPALIPENPELIPEYPELIPENPDLIPENPELIPENPEVIPDPGNEDNHEIEVTVQPGDVAPGEENGDHLEEPETEPVEEIPEEENNKPDIMNELLKSEQFWKWLGEWTATYMDLLEKHTRKIVIQEICKREKSGDQMCPLDDNPENTGFIIKDGKMIVDGREIDMTHTDNMDSELKRHQNNKHKNKGGYENKIEASTIYGNSVGNEKVTNVFIFTADKAEEVIDKLKPTNDSEVDFVIDDRIKEENKDEPDEEKSIEDEINVEESNVDDANKSSNEGTVNKEEPNNEEANEESNDGEVTSEVTNEESNEGEGNKESNVAEANTEELNSEEAKKKPDEGEAPNEESKEGEANGESNVAEANTEDLNSEEAKKEPNEGEAPNEESKEGEANDESNVSEASKEDAKIESNEGVIDEDSNKKEVGDSKFEIDDDDLNIDEEQDASGDIGKLDDEAGEESKQDSSEKNKSKSKDYLEKK